MEQLERYQFAHYVNTTPAANSENWTLEGVGVDALSIAYNPQVDQYRQIIDKNASANFQGYQIQSAISGKRIFKGDAMYEFLDAARRQAKSIETQYLEVDMAYESNDNYQATKFDILIVINEFLGENATISYDVYFRGDPIQGMVSISNNAITFTESQ